MLSKIFMFFVRMFLFVLGIIVAFLSAAIITIVTFGFIDGDRVSDGIITKFRKLIFPNREKMIDYLESLVDSNQGHATFIEFNTHDLDFSQSLGYYSSLLAENDQCQAMLDQLQKQSLLSMLWNG
jgi:hypothetical protein